MDKPITLQAKEFSEQIVELINVTTLPAFIICNILSSIASSVAELAVKQEAEDAIAWNEYQKSKELENG